MTFIVAEIGVNWDGNYELLKEMMFEVKQSGCNAVKFQAYQEETVKNHPEYIRLMNSTVTSSNVKQINEVANSIGIEWFCTPMYPEAVEFLEPFVKRYKLRVFDGRPLLKDQSSPLIERVLSTNKEIIASVETTPKNCKYFNSSRISWLYCVPKYPCSLSDLDFTDIHDFNGYSNHCPSLIAPLTAAILGAKIIEVHITSDKSKTFVDNNVSFDYSELRELVDLIRHSEKIKKTKLNLDK